MPEYYHNVSRGELEGSTRALLKFCREHGYPEGGLEQIEGVACSLAANDIQEAVAHFRKVPLGGMGCFNDWIPDVVYKHEDAQYVSAEFEALLERWSRLGRTAAGAQA